jgi:hypothetical protein
MQYLLPCSCGRKLTVDRSQAGLRLPCACGASVEVPTFRGLKELEPVADSRPAAAPENPWGPRQGVIFLGVVIAICGAALSGVLWFQRPTFNTPQVNHKALQESMQGLTLEQSFEAWTDILEHRLDRNPAPQLAEYHKQVARNDRGLGVGASAIAAGAIMIVSALLSAPRGARKKAAKGRAAAES